MSSHRARWWWTIGQENLIALALSEVEGIQGAGPQIVFWGGWLPKVTYLMVKSSPPAPPLHTVPPPPH